MNRIFVGLAVATMVGNAMAGDLTLVTSRADLAGNDHVSWGNAGAPGARPGNPFSVSSYGGIGVTASQGGTGGLGIYIQSPASDYQVGFGWGGNFAVGDYVLGSTSGLNRGPLILGLASPVSAIGAQIESDFTGAFTAKLEAFDASHHSLGVLTEAGFGDYTADNSAIFLGVRDTDEEIASVEFSILASKPVDQGLLGINELSFTSTSSVPGTNPDVNPPPPSTNVAPEPSSLAMGSAAIAALMMARRMLRKAA